MKRILVLFLALIMVLGVLAACGPQQEGGGEKKPVEQDKEADQYLPVKSYKGKTYTVLYREGQRYEEEWVSDESSHGDVINDAIASRNQAVIDRYSVTLDYKSGKSIADWNVFWPKIINNTEDDTFQLIVGKTYDLAAASVTGYCLNWLNEEQVPVVHLNEEWWDGDFTEAAQYRGCSYIATGPLSLTDMYSSACVYFNKTMLRNKLGSNADKELFALVENGEWTLAKLIEYARLCTEKIEGAEDDTDDIYGLSSNFSTMIDAYIYASNLVMTERGIKDGQPTIVLKKVDKSNPILNLAETLTSFYRTSKTVKNDGDFQAAPDGLEMVRAFCASKAVFSTGTLESAKSIQNYGKDILYGVIPYPKYDATQKEYYTYKLDYKSGFSIPRSVKEDNREFVGTITDALAYYSNKFVKPALYDKVLTHKNVQDKDSSKFVTMVINGGLYEFANIYARAWGDTKGPAHLLREVVKTGADFSYEFNNTRKSFYETGLTTLLKGFRTEDVN